MEKPFILQNYDETSLAWIPVERYETGKEAIHALAETTGVKLGRYRVFSLASQKVVAEQNNTQVVPIIKNQ